jgi:hypothetical protein
VGGVAANRCRIEHCRSNRRNSSILHEPPINRGPAIFDEVKRRATAKIEVKTERGELVAVAEHILKWVAPPAG